MKVGWHNDFLLVYPFLRLPFVGVNQHETPMQSLIGNGSCYSESMCLMHQPMGCQWCCPFPRLLALFYYEAHVP